MILVTPGPGEGAAARVVAAMAARGHQVTPADALARGDEPVTLVVHDGPFIFNFAATVASLGRRPFRVLMLSRLGAHPDARAASLQRLWRLEEHVRGGGAPTLTLRLAPVLGPDTPLWNKLRSRPSLPRGGRTQLNPVAECDVIETVSRALADGTPWSGWYEVAGPRVWTLAELRMLAAGGGSGGVPGAWEPAKEEMLEHRLAESGPWCERFALTPTAIEDAVGQEVRT